MIIPDAPATITAVTARRNGDSVEVQFWPDCPAPDVYYVFDLPPQVASSLAGQLLDVAIGPE